MAKKLYRMSYKTKTVKARVEDVDLLVERRLNEMAIKGWRLRKITNLGTFGEIVSVMVTMERRVSTRLKKGG